MHKRNSSARRACIRRFKTRRYSNKRPVGDLGLIARLEQLGGADMGDVGALPAGDPRKP